LPEIVCNTSPVQYLHQLGLLHLLPSLADRITIPTAVAEELDEGRRLGVSLPDVGTLACVTILSPPQYAGASFGDRFGARRDRGAGLGTRNGGDPIVILDEALARRAAEFLGLRLTGTLGLLIDAKRKGVIPQVTPVLRELQALGFRVAGQTRAAVLKLAGESEGRRAG